MDKQNLKKKILYIITKGNWGGAQRYVYDLATNLPKDLYTAVVAHGAGVELPNKLNKAHIKTITIENLGRDIKIWNDIKVFFELLKIFKQERPYIVHLNSSKIGGLGALACRFYNLTAENYKLKAIFTAHGWPFKENRNILMRYVMKFFSWLTVFLSHTTIVVSEDDFEKSKKFPFVTGKIHTIHNGISKFPLKEGFRARQFLGSNIAQGTWIGTISELHPNKGIDKLIRAYKEISEEYRDTALVLIGDGQERKNLESLVTNLNLNNHIYFLGHIENAREYLKAFDIFTLTSHKEGLPYAILEAGFASLPVVASKIGGIPEIVQDERSGILVESEKEIYKGLQTLLHQPDMRKELGKELNGYIQEYFNLELCMKKTLILYV